MDILISCPVAYKASSNGVLVSETDNGIIRTAFYKHRYPVASYLVAFGVTNYKVLNHSVQLGSITLPMITYCYPEDETAFATQTPKVLQQLSLFNQYFGEYPFIKERYGHTQFSWGGGMEHQTNSFITSPAESLMAHELGHQWFGDKVTCGSWQDIWLNEGFATYLANFHFDNVDPGSRLTRLFNLQSSITSSPGGSVWVDDTTNVSRIFSGRLSYNKGAYLVHMLRWVLGDSAFFRGLRQYLNDPLVTYGFARTDDLKRNLEQISGKDLTEFFNDWFKGQGYPNYTVRWSQNNNSWARIRVNQTQSHNSVSFFEMPLALKFKNSSQEKTVIVNNSVNNEILWEDIGFVADTVLVDPEFWILTRTNFSIKENQLSDNENEVRVFPVPAHTSELTVLIRNPSEEICSVSLFNTKGQLLVKLKHPTPGRDEEIKMNIDRYPPGLYVVKVDGNNFHVTKKIIIQ
jgi:aminopeptidase N